jgi:glycosyltransferase involved in cell wall biosynthesis
MKKPVILVIENSIDVTGALKSIVRIAYDLHPFFDFIFIIPKNSRGRFWVEKFGFNKIYELRMIELSKRLFSLLLYFPFLFVNARSLIKIIRHERVTLIHSNDLYNMLPAVIRALGSRTPYVCHIRFMPDRFPAWIFNFWMKQHLLFAAKVIAVSKSVFNLLPKHPKISVIYGELPLSESYPYFNRGDRIYFVFLYLSNFMAGKGQELAIEAFAKIHKALPDWRLRFVGSDMGLKRNKEYVRGLMRQTEQLNIAQKIDWAEFTNDVEWEYKHADIVLNFSQSESFSITCLEALYYGRPLIAADCGGPAEIINQGVTGVLVPNKNIIEMAEAMKQIALHGDKRENMGTAARIAVREKFSVENTSFLVREIFNQVLDRNSK